jgi:hypothetical protein
MRHPLIERYGFTLGNVLLGVALLMLLFIDRIWAAYGALAMAAWMVVAGIGMYLVMSEKRSSDLPD